MPDITMCTNNDCPMADNCCRYGCPPDKFKQAYQKFEPIIDDDNDICECKYFLNYPNYNECD